MNKLLSHKNNKIFSVLLSYTRYDIVIICILISVIGTFYITTIRSGQNLWGDFALYIAHAKNIATGAPYSDTNFVYNTNFKALSPRQYPPVFPIFLSVIYKIYGLNLFYMKLMNIFVFLLSMSVYYYILRQYTSKHIAAICVATFSFMPYIWQYKDNIMSEFIFILFSLCALGLWEVIARQDENQRSVGRVVALSLAVSAFIALSYGTRSIGIVLLPAMMIHGIVIHRKIKLESWIVGISFTSFYLIYNYYTKSDESYLVIFKSYYLSLPYYSFIVYIKSLILLWSGDLGSWSGNTSLSSTPLSMALSMSTYIIAMPLVIIGFIVVNRNYISVISVFVILYIILLLVFPSRSAPRYLLPILPWFVYYMISGITWVAGLLKRGKSIALSIFLVLFSATYVSAYGVIGFSPMINGIDKRENLELFAFIKKNTSTSDVIVFRVPRILALYTDRKSAGYDIRYRGDPWPVLKKVGATYLVVPTPASPFWRPRGGMLTTLVSKYPERVKAVFHNTDYTVYKIR